MGWLFDKDLLTKTKRLFHWNDADESFHIETLQDATEIAESNKHQYNQVDERAGWKGDMNKVASIPMNIYMDLEARGITRDEKRFKAWLNAPENRVFRTRPGRV